MDNVKVASQKFISAYQKDTPTSLKLIDVYLVYIMLSGILQFVYMMIAGTFPYNAFLAGFISTVGSFVLAGKTYHCHCICSSRTYPLFLFSSSQSSHPNQFAQQRQVQNCITRTVM
jgi:oligosaccharyltransferase complex subunit epsilon